MSGRPTRELGLRIVLIGGALLLLTVYWMLLRIHPRSVLRRASAARPDRESPDQAADASLIRAVVSAVDRAAHLHPLTPRCLERALAARALVKCRGGEARVVVGVCRKGVHLDAHAWIETSLTSGAGPPVYTPFVQLS